MDNRAGITIRSILIGIVLIIGCTVMAQYSVNLVHGSYMSIDHMPVAAISLFFFLIFVLHIFVTVIRKRIGLSATELLVIYIMGFVGCSVATMGLGTQILAILAAPYYYASGENGWEELIQPHIKGWMVPQGEEEITGFFEGSWKGHLPWGVWVKPLLYWAPFLLALYVVMICIPIIMRRQWIERERLQFPLAQLPLAMVSEGEKPGSTPFLRNKLMWLGFAIPVIICSLSGLSKYFPGIPPIPLVQEISTFRQTQKLTFRMSFPVIGFLYLVNLDVSCSLWFFYLVSHVLQGWCKITGLSSTAWGMQSLGIYGTGFVIFNHLGTGALIVFVLYGLWKAKAHLKEVFLKAFTGRSSLDDSQELVPYRFAVIAILISVVIMVGWLSFSGLPPLFAFLFVVLALIIYFGITRIVVETGIPTLISPGIAPAQLISSFGTIAVTKPGLVSLAFTHIYAADIRTFVMSAASNALRIAEGIKRRRRWLFPCMLLAIVVSFVTAVVVNLHLAYTYGGINCNSWYFQGGPIHPFDLVREKILHPHGPGLTGWILKAAGGLVMGVLMFLKARFLWWPLHPVGWAIGHVYWVEMLWFSIFIAWLIKLFILRYGGANTYRNARPFFFGLILGQYVVAVMWFLIDLKTGMQGNSVFWI